MIVDFNILLKNWEKKHKMNILMTIFAVIAACGLGYSIEHHDWTIGFGSGVWLVLMIGSLMINYLERKNVI